MSSVFAESCNFNQPVHYPICKPPAEPVKSPKNTNVPTNHPPRTPENPLVEHILKFLEHYPVGKQSPIIKSSRTC